MKYFLNIKISALLILLTMFFSFCSKKSDSSSTPSNSTPAANKVCDGNGKTSYYPMDLTNKWTYNMYMSGIKQSTYPSETASSTKTIGGQTYVMLSDPSGFFHFDDQPYREDATSHNIYWYDSDEGKEFLEIPANPVINQSWAYGASYTRKVTNISATFKTHACVYTGLLEITEYEGTDFSQKLLYKKGLGLVYKQEPGIISGYTTYELSSVTLK